MSLIAAAFFSGVAANEPDSCPGGEPLCGMGGAFKGVLVTSAVVIAVPFIISAVYGVNEVSACRALRRSAAAAH